MLIHTLFEIYSYMMIAWIIMSWIPELRNSKFGYWLGRLTEPYFSIFRRFIPPLGMIDISPIVAFFVYRILVNLIIGQLLPLLLPL